MKKKASNERPPKEVGWFTRDKSPARRGAYRTRAAGLGVGFSYFSGAQWGNQRADAEKAVQSWTEYGASGMQEKEWCGLAAPTN